MAKLDLISQSRSLGFLFWCEISLARLGSLALRTHCRATRSKARLVSKSKYEYQVRRTSRKCVAQNHSYYGWTLGVRCMEKKATSSEHHTPRIDLFSHFSGESEESAKGESLCASVKAQENHLRLLASKIFHASRARGRSLRSSKKRRVKAKKIVHFSLADHGRLQEKWPSVRSVTRRDQIKHVYWTATVVIFLSFFVLHLTHSFLFL